MSNWEDSFSEIRADREHGATQIYRRALAILSDISEGSLIRSQEDLRQIILTLHRAQPAMAPLHYLAEKLSNLKFESSQKIDSNLDELIAQLERDSQLAHSRIVTHFENLSLNPASIMLHSRSETVYELVREAIGLQTRIFISEGRPGMEGLDVAGGLVLEGYTVKTFVDDARGEVLKDVDLILVGADWVSERDFTNKIGSYSIALLAQQFGKPMYVAADATKFAHSRFRVDPTAARPAKQSFFQEILFEVTPLSLITAIASDVGILSPQEISSHFETPSR